MLVDWTHDLALIPRLISSSQRVWTESVRKPKPWRPHRRARSIRHILTIDTETTTDHTHRLVFGCASTSKLVRTQGHITLEKGYEYLFYADTLPNTDPDKFKVLEAYASTNDVIFLSQREFIDTILWDCIKSSYRIVGYNLAFDLSRLAYGYGTARGGEKAFSLRLWKHCDGTEKCPKAHPDDLMCKKDHPWRPRIVIQKLGAKSRSYNFRWQPGKATKTNTRMLDVSQLSSSLTDKMLPLKPKHPDGKSACSLWGVEHKTGSADEHGDVTPEYIDYCRADVEATTMLAARTIEELERHPVNLDPANAHTPASIGKAHYQAMNVVPPLVQTPGFARVKLGESMAAYFGGRTEMRIRMHPVPVVVVDFLSQYPSACVLLGIWELLTADQLDTEDCTDWLTGFLEWVRDDGVAAVLDRDVWRHFVGVVKVQAAGDVVAPVRGNPTDQCVGPTSHLTMVARQTADEPRVLTIADVVASVLLTRQIPRIVEAWRLVGHGRQKNLKTILFPDAGEINPYTDDPYARWIELRKHIQNDPSVDDVTKQRVGWALKIIANSTSYGVFAQCIHKSGVPGTMHVQNDSECWKVDAESIEEFGEYAMPTFAAAITAGGRLMLAIVERMISDRGGVFAFCDTDSMGIVATPQRSFVPCPGGNAEHDGSEPDGQIRGVWALSYNDVQEIVDAFEALHPYNRDMVPGTFLEVEKYCLDERKRIQHVQMFGISSKRYVLYRETDTDRNIVKMSLHGVGVLVPAIKANDPDEWFRQIWQYTLSKYVDGVIDEPEWLSRMAVRKVPVNTPHVASLLQNINAGLPYSQQIKPYGFVLMTRIASLDGGMHDERTFIGPYCESPGEWERQEWIGLASGSRYELVIEDHTVSDVDTGCDCFAGESCSACSDADTTGSVNGICRGAISYASVLNDWMTNPEHKFIDGSGKPCTRKTRGFLYRQHVKISRAVTDYVGRGTLRSDSGQVLDLEEDLNPAVVTEYRADEDAFWREYIVPAIRIIGTTEIARRLKVNRQNMHKWLSGKTRPRKATRDKLLKLLYTMLRFQGYSSSPDVRVLVTELVDGGHTYLPERSSPSRARRYQRERLETLRAMIAIQESETIDAS